MERTQHKQDEATVEFSDTACMQTSFGAVWSAFQRNSYIARVTFDDGRIVCVALPWGAAAGHRPRAYLTTAIDAARSMPDGGSVFL